MNIVKVGDREKAICNKCKSLVEITYQLRNVPFSDGRGIVNSVMTGVCNQCDSVAVMPHQSTPAIKNQIEKQRKALESRVPAHMIDILNLTSEMLGGSTESIPNIMKYYIHALSVESISHSGIKRYLNSNLATGKSEKRISLKGSNIIKETETLKQLTNIDTTTDLLKGVVLKINDDILIHKRKNPISHLKNIIAATA